MRFKRSRTPQSASIPILAVLALLAGLAVALNIPGGHHQNDVTAAQAQSATPTINTITVSKADGSGSYHYRPGDEINVRVNLTQPLVRCTMRQDLKDHNWVYLYFFDRTKSDSTTYTEKRLARLHSIVPQHLNFRYMV